MRQAIGHWPSNHLYGALICIVVMVRSSSGVGRLQLQRVSGDINASADCGTDAGSDNWRYTHIHTRWRIADQLPIAVLQPHGVRQPFRVGYRDLIFLEAIWPQALRRFSLLHQLRATHSITGAAMPQVRAYPLR